jgi:hypothetical protein
MPVPLEAKSCFNRVKNRTAVKEIALRGRVLLLIVFAAAAAFAQPGGGRSGGRGGAGDMPMMMGGGQQRLSKFDRVSDRLKLNKEQKAEAGTVLDAVQAEALPVADSLIKARAGVAESMINGHSQDDLSRAIVAYEQLSAQMTGFEAKALSQILAKLKPNQQSKAGPAFDEMSGIFMSRDWRQVR